MKRLIAILVLSLASTVTMAHPGGHTLTCTSAKNSGSKQVIEVSLARSNRTGWWAPKIQITVDGKQYLLDTPDEMNNYGETINDAPLGVVTVSADTSANKEAKTYGAFSVVAIPNTVKAFDEEGKPVSWKFEDEKDGCSYSNGKATFQGILHGYIGQGQQDIDIDTQIMDCELNYNSGMAC